MGVCFVELQTNKLQKNTTEAAADHTASFLNHQGCPIQLRLQLERFGARTRPFGHLFSFKLRGLGFKSQPQGVLPSAGHCLRDARVPRQKNNASTNSLAICWASSRKESEEKIGDDARQNERSKCPGMSPVPSFKASNHRSATNCQRFSKSFWIFLFALGTKECWLSSSQPSGQNPICGHSGRHQGAGEKCRQLSEKAPFCNALRLLIGLCQQICVTSKAGQLSDRCQLVFRSLARLIIYLSR